MSVSFVSKVHPSRPSRSAVHGPLWQTPETIGVKSPCRLFKKFIPAARHGQPSMARPHGPLWQTSETIGVGNPCLCFKSPIRRPVTDVMGRRLFQKFVRAGRDGCPWRAAGMDFWNKRHGFFTPIVAKVHKSGPWGRAVDGQPWRAAGMDFWNKRHRFLAPIVSEVPQSGPWEPAVDRRPWRAAGWTFETYDTDSWRRLFQKSVRAGRGRTAVTGRRDGLFKQTAQISGADCCRS